MRVRGGGAQEHTPCCASLSYAFLTTTKTGKHAAGSHTHTHTHTLPLLNPIDDLFEREFALPCHLVGSLRPSGSHRNRGSNPSLFTGIHTHTHTHTHTHKDTRTHTNTHREALTHAHTLYI